MAVSAFVSEKEFVIWCFSKQDQSRLLTWFHCNRRDKLGTLLLEVSYLKSLCVCVCVCVSLFIAINAQFANFSLPTVLISVSLGFFLYIIKSLIPHLIRHLSVQGANTFLTQL